VFIIGTGRGIQVRSDDQVFLPLEVRVRPEEGRKVDVRRAGCGAEIRTADRRVRERAEGLRHQEAGRMAEHIVEVSESLDADERVSAAVRNVRSAGVGERALMPVDEVAEVDAGAIRRRQEIVGLDLLRGYQSGAAEKHRPARRKQYMPSGR